MDKQKVYNSHQFEEIASHKRNTSKRRMKKIYLYLQMKTMKLILPMNLKSIIPSIIDYKSRYLYEIFKRVVDIIFCLLPIVPSLILICIFCFLTIIDSIGNPIFTQIRVGKNGKLIKIHKLKNMKIDIEKDGQWAETDDTRITKIGKFIREYRIDELPQLIDVLFGKCH